MRNWPSSPAAIPGEVHLSMSFKKFLTIHNSSTPYMLWDICKESPNYSKYARLVAHLLGNMFTGARYYACKKCGQENAAETKHLLMFCRCTEEFRNTCGEN